MKAQDLKKSILQYAMQGKLVAQDPNDEPASELLRRIKAEKEQLIKDGKIKKEKPLPPITQDEIPHDLPQGWEWVRLGNIGDWGSGSTPNKSRYAYYLNGNINWLKTGDLNDGYITEIPQKITELALKETSVKIKPIGSLLIAMYGATIGKLGILKIPATTNQACCACVAFSGIEIKYLFYYLLAERDNLKKRGAGAAQPNISREKIIAYLFPLPLLAEQKRIVEKLEEILPLVDEYGKNEEILSEMNQKLPKQIRQSILQYAVQGKLVVQNPQDEPASELLKRIKAEKEQLIKDGKIKKEKPLTPITQDEIPYDLPQGWQWVRLGEITSIARGGSPRPIQAYLTNDANGIPWIKIGDTQKNGKYINSTKEYIIPEGISKSRLVHKGDFLLTNSMSFGRPYILNIDGCIHDGWLVISNLFKVLDNNFLYYLLSSNIIYVQFCTSVSGAVVQNLNSTKVADTIIPLPPLAEQKRIVAKVEELMNLVNKLES